MTEATKPSDTIFGVDMNYALSGFIFLISLFTAIIPKALSNSKRFMKFMPILIVFVTGMQLSTIIHIIMEISEPHDHHSKLANSPSHDKNHSHEHSHEHNHEHNQEHNHGNKLYPFSAIGYIFLLLLSIDAIFLHGDDNKKESNERNHKKAKENENQTKDESHDHHNTSGAHTHSHHSEHDHSLHKCEGHQTHGCHETIGTCSTSAVELSENKTEALIAILAISFHSLFEGLNVNSNSSRMFIFGLSFHKFVESFSIGSSLSSSVLPASTKFLLILLYSTLTPISIILRNIKSLDFIFEKIKIWIDGMCLGSLFFVVFFEAIGHSFHGGKKMKTKSIAILLGYTLGIISLAFSH